MHHHYADITSRIAEPPRWWDEEAVPRYCDFAPNEVANIYAREVALVEIACQACDTRFLVAFSQQYLVNLYTGMPVPTLTRQAQDGTLHYGDPPNAWCCPSGPTMNSEPLRVVEFWRLAPFEWERVPELEVAQRCEWSTRDASPEVSR